MKAGKHVLTEKLLGHSVHECKEMARVAKETGLHLATGHQRHYNVLYDSAVQLIRKGIMGDLHYIRAQWHRGNLPGTDSWQQPLPTKAKPKDELAGKLDGELASWKRKLDGLKKAREPKPDEIALWEAKVAQKIAQIADEAIASQAKELGYQDAKIAGVYDRPAIEELIRWRLWDRTGGGLMAELGSHQLDAASIFIAAMHGGKKQYPQSVNAMASRPIFPADRDVDEVLVRRFDPRQLPILTMGLVAPSGRPDGIIVKTSAGVSELNVADGEDDMSAQVLSLAWTGTADLDLADEGVTGGTDGELQVDGVAAASARESVEAGVGDLRWQGQLSLGAEGVGAGGDALGRNDLVHLEDLLDQCAEVVFANGPE
jgi:hypothetical protein